MKVMEEEGNLANMEVKGIASTETDDLEAVPSGSPSVLAQESLVCELSTPITDVV